MDTTREQRDAIRRHIINAVTLIVDNERHAKTRLAQAAQLAVIYNMGFNHELADYADMWHGREFRWERRDYARVAGNAVCDELEQIINEHDDSLIKTILIDVLDLHDSKQREMIGDLYLPDPADIGYKEDDHEPGTLYCP